MWISTHFNFKLSIPYYSKASNKNPKKVTTSKEIAFFYTHPYKCRADFFYS